MARVQFDRDNVVEKSTKLFWQHGYSGTSMQQVFDITGLKPGSVYLAFDGKEGLFRECIEQYTENSLENINTCLSEAPSIGDGICLILEKMVAESARNDYYSCFLVKSQLELATAYPELHKFIAAQLQRIEQLYANYLKSEFDDSAVVSRVTSLMLHIFGVRVYGYHQTAERAMLLGLREGLPWLPWLDRN